MNNGRAILIQKSNAADPLNRYLFMLGTVTNSDGTFYPQDYVNVTTSLLTHLFHINIVI